MTFEDQKRMKKLVARPVKSKRVVTTATLARKMKKLERAKGKLSGLLQLPIELFCEV